MRAKSFNAILLCLSIVVAPWLISGFVRTAAPSRFRAERRNLCRLFNSNDDERPEEEEEQKRDVFDWDLFLDTPFFDPDQVVNDPNSPPLLKGIAAWVQKDYATAELILTGVLFVLLIIASQELLRIQMYGVENYVPFTKGVLPGNLF
jgi:hypothetical protein